jgi:hypothetical protein
MKEITQKSKLILFRLQKIEEQTKEIYEENKELHDRMLNNDIELSVLSEEKKEIIMKLL